MGKDYKDFELDDFLEDVDFCQWSKGLKPELDETFSKLLDKHPRQTSVFKLANRIVNYLDDEKITSDPLQKLHIWEGINKAYQKQNRIAKIRMSLKYAAVFILTISIVSSIIFISKSGFESKFVAEGNIENLTETRLVLSQNQQIRIESDRTQIDYEVNDGQIQVDGKLIAEKKEDDSNIMNHELIVPYGKQAKIVLSDRSEVWVNAGSRIVFPSQFRGKKRKVLLEGEAFFKVTKDKTKPFIVETSEMKINVLGTSFNVKAYPEEKYHESVLVEGSISLDVGSSLFSKSLKIEPNQRVLISQKNSEYTISTVDVNNYISWIDGLFSFENEPIPSVLRRVSRFYNLKVEWDHSVEEIKISGKLDLKDDYQRVLKTLALISGGDFTLKQGVIYYSQN